MSEKTMPVTGGCFCGSVRYKSTDAPVDVCYCHCRMCQQSSGNPYFLGAFFTKKTFRFTHGKPKFYSQSTTPWVERGFCAECGTPLIFRDFTETHAIYIATLDHPDEWPPTLGHSGMESRIPWDTINDDLPCWETESDLELNKTRDEYDKLSAQLREGSLTKEGFAQQLKLMFEIGPVT